MILCRLQCIPLYSLLAALGRPTVHWLVLDIEGAELQVLRTLPWAELDIWVVSVETDLAGLVLPGSRQEILQLLQNAGYTHRPHARLVNPSSISNTAKDDMFIRNDIATKLGIRTQGKIEL